MKRSLIYLFCLLSHLLLAKSVCAIEPPESRGITILAASYVEDTGQELTELSNANWQSRKSYIIPKDFKNIWLKMSFILTDSQSNGLFISTLSSHEIYWDNTFIGRSGTIGYHPDQETPGLIDTTFRVPDQLLTTGEHQLLIKLSRHHLPIISSHNIIDVAIAPYDIVQQQLLFNAYLPFFALGALLVVAIFFISLSLGSPNFRSYLAFAILCLLVAALLLAESWRPLWSYPYNWHLTRLVIVALLTIAISTVLPYVMLKEFDAKHIKQKITICVSLYFITLFVIPSFDLSALLMVIFALSFSLIIVLRAVIRQKLAEPYLITSLTFCVICAAILPDFLESWFFLLFGLVMLAILHRLANTVRALREQAHQKQLVNEQLKLELVKAHIQPHFLMNTLTSLAEWIEQSPQIAQELIEALAEEFRILIRIVDHPLIQIEEELRLCQLHVKVMSLRQDKPISLDIKGAIQGFNIPPGIIHTLIENAISHSQNLVNTILTIAIELAISADNKTIYVCSPLSKEKNPHTIGLGTGRRYIEARLNSIYKNNFIIDEWAENEQWHSKITIRTTKEQNT